MSRGAFLLALAAWLVAASVAEAHKPTVTSFTYHTDIYPIFAAKCGSCHRAGGVAPMSLMTYAEAFPWAVSIKNEILHMEMPPWFADERYGAFRHDGSLSALEMNTIVDWCLGGSPEGTASPSAAPMPADGWPLGPPDIEFTMPAPVVLDVNTSELVHEVVLAPALESAVSLSSLDFKPGAANVVRSAEVSIVEDGTLVAAWVPGQVAERLPEDLSRAIPAGSSLKLRVRYKKTWLDDGSPVEDQSAVALYLRAEPARRSLRSVSVSAGDSYAIEEGSELVALLPRIDQKVEALLAELVHADGSRTPILRLARPRAAWPTKYWLEVPLELPPGSRVEVTAEGDGAEHSAPAFLLDLTSS